MKEVSPYGYWDISDVIFNYQTRNYTVLKMKSYDNHNKLIKSTEDKKRSYEFVENNPRYEAVVNEVLAFKGMQREIRTNPLEKKP